MKEINNRTFYDANEAYKMSKEIQDEIERNELSSLFNDIDTYVRVGKYECNVVKLSEFQKQWLIDHGYKVSVIHKPKHWTNNMININWDKNGNL